jgi:hypothetical protein
MRISANSRGASPPFAPQADADSFPQGPVRSAWAAAQPDPADGGALRPAVLHHESPHPQGRCEGRQRRSLRRPLRTVLVAGPVRCCDKSQLTSRGVLALFLSAMNPQRELLSTITFRHPAGWIAWSLLFLILDFISGPLVQFPITFVIPVVLAAWNGKLRWALGFAVVLGAARLGFYGIWDAEWLSLVSLTNAAIRIAVLAIVAVFVSRYRAARERVQILQGLLPICMFCKKIRDENDHWHSLESYIGERSEASFSHGLCPECKRKHYPEIYEERPSR